MIERENFIVVRPEKLEKLLNSKEIKKEFLPGMLMVVNTICDWDGFMVYKDKDGNFAIMEGYTFLNRLGKWTNTRNDL